MTAAPDTQKKSEDLNFSEKLSDFIQKNRKTILIGFAILLVILAGVIIITTVRDNLRSKALSKVEEFIRTYNSLRITDSADDPNMIFKAIETAAFMEEVSAFASKNSGYASAKAYSLYADIQWDQQKYAEAEKAWLNSAKAAAKSYLAPVSYYNAAVAAEEQGNIGSAIEHYKMALGFGNVFPSAARAQFSVGRLEESRDNTEAALGAYRSLLSTWPDDPVWSNLAQSRILALSR